MKARKNRQAEYQRMNEGDANYRLSRIDEIESTLTEIANEWMEAYQTSPLQDAKEALSNAIAAIYKLDEALEDLRH